MKTRSIYSIFDFFRDMGGLGFILTSIASFLNLVFTINKMENKLVSQLYQKPSTFSVEDLNSMSGSKVHTIEGNKKLKASEQSVSRELFQGLHCFGRRCCNEGDLTDRIFAVGRENLARDINLIRIVRSLRVFESYAADRMSKQELERMKKEARKIEIEQFINDDNASDVMPDDP